MKTIRVTMVRIYISESSHLMEDIINYLKKEVAIRGVSVFRAICGFGDSGEHSSLISDLSLNLPLTIEFFDDDKDKVKQAITHINELIKPEHMVTWDADSYL